MDSLCVFLQKLFTVLCGQAFLLGLIKHISVQKHAIEVICCAQIMQTPEIVIKYLLK